MHEEGGGLALRETQLGQAGADLAFRFIRPIALGDSERAAHDLPDGQVGHGASVGHAVPLQERRGRALEVLAQLQEQARLAEAGRAGDAHHLAMAAGRGREARHEKVQLLLASHEGDQVSARAIAESGALRADEAVQIGRRAGEVEAPVQKGGGGLRHENPRAREVAHHAVEGARHLLRGLGVGIGHLTAAVNRDGGDVDEHGDHARLLAGDLALHGHGRVHGAPRGVLHGLQPEHGDDVPAGDGLLPSPEHLDLVQQGLVDPSGGDHLRIGARGEARSQKGESAQPPGEGQSPPGSAAAPAPRPPVLADGARAGAGPRPDEGRTSRCDSGAYCG